jgi:arylsulfatase A-like enzyme
MPPNFVFILTDQQRRDSLGCYGNPLARTPAIDALAAGGIAFDQAYTANVICSPSRASIMTGRYPRCHGLATNGMKLDEREITLPQTLCEHGYRTAAVGKIHLAPLQETDPQMAAEKAAYCSPESEGFWEAGGELPLPYYGFQEVRLCNGHGDDYAHYYRDLRARAPKLPELFKRQNALRPPSGAPSSWKSALPEEHHSSAWVADEAIAKLENYARAEDPFFLFVSIPDPHFPYCPPAPWCDMFDPADVPMPRRHRDEVQTASRHVKERHEQYARILGYQPIDMPEAHIREIIAHTYGMVSLLDKHVGRIVDALDRLGLRDETIVVFTTDHGEHLGDHWFIYKVVQYDELMHLPLIWSWPRRFGSPRRQGGIVSHIDLMSTILDLAGVRAPHGVQGISYRTALDGDAPATHQGRRYAYLEDDEADGVRFGRTIVTPTCRLTYRLPEAEGEFFNLEDDPRELVNRWHDAGCRKLRQEAVEMMLQATMGAADPKPRRYSPV